VGDAGQGGSNDRGTLKFQKRLLLLLLALLQWRFREWPAWAVELPRNCWNAGKEEPFKGVKVEVGDKEAAIDLYIMLNTGAGYRRYPGTYRRK